MCIENLPLLNSTYIGNLSVPLNKKTNFISTLVHRALKCTKSKINEEIKHIKNIQLDNGYPESIIDSNISKKIAQFSMPKRFGPEKCPVYLKVPWIGKASIGLDKNVKTALESCYGSVTTRVLFTSKRMLRVARKDVLPITLKSSVIYEYSCHYDSRYKDEHYSDYKIESSSMFLNGYNSKQSALHDLNPLDPLSQWFLTFAKLPNP